MRLSSIAWIFVIVCAASALYAVKYRVQGMDEEITALKNEIRAEKQALHVLNAEWAYLTRPERINRLAGKYLDLVPVTGLQLADVAEVPFPAEGDVRVVDADKQTVSPAGVAPVSATSSASAPKLRPGVVPTGGAGYVR